MSGLKMFFDTETTGRGDFKRPYNDPVQPDLIQLGYRVVNERRMTVFEIGHLVNPSRPGTPFVIEQGAKDVHHIEEQDCIDHGWLPEPAMEQFLYWLGECSEAIAHNKQYDMMVMQCFAFRHGFSPDIFSKVKTTCTMQICTPICKIQGPYGVKWPKLIEAYCNLVDQKGFKDAHNALVDVNACAEIYFTLEDKGLIPHAA